MPFLRSKDYVIYIQPNQLTQLLQSGATQLGISQLEVRILAENDAQEEISQYIRQKYDVEKAFSDTCNYNPVETYYAYNLVELVASAWVAQTVYSVNLLVLWTDNKIYVNILQTASLWINENYTAGAQVLYTDGNYYQCILNTTLMQVPTNATYWELITSQNPGNTSYWTSLGWNLQMFYLKYPYPLFEITRHYKIGDNVYWKGSIYTAIKPSMGLDDEARIQFDYTTEFPQPNYFPGEENNPNSVAQWGEGTPYSVTGVNWTSIGPAWANAPNWVSQNYTAGQYVIYTDGNLYKCILNTTLSQAPGNATYWTEEAEQYAQGNLVTYNGKLYIALVNNTNIIPGSDIVTWVSICWKCGDNRNKSLVCNMVHITLWNLHNNIAPQNIPMIREKNHIKAIKWCEEIKEGILVVDLYSMPVLQPPKGGRILIGSRPKNNNNWVILLILTLASLIK